MYTQKGVTCFKLEDGMFILTADNPQGYTLSAIELRTLPVMDSSIVIMEANTQPDAVRYIYRETNGEKILECSDYVIVINPRTKITVTCKADRSKDIARYCTDMQAKLQRLYCTPYKQQDWTHRFK